MRGDGRLQDISAFSFSEIRAVEDYLDVEGRPLGEHRARCPVSVAMELKVCPYRDSRRHHKQPMNTSALRHISTHWAEAMALICAFHARFEDRYGRLPTGTADQLRLTSAIAAIPAWMKNRTTTPVPSAEVPAAVASLYKVAIGFRRLLRVLGSGELMTGAAEKTVALSVDDVYEFADLGGFLVGAEQVCAGTRTQISEAAEALLFGRSTVEPDHERLGDALLDSDRFFEFAESIFRIECMEAAVQTSAVVSLQALRTSSTTDLLDRRVRVGKPPTHGAWLAVLLCRLVGLRVPTLDERLRHAITAVDETGAIQHFIETRRPEQLGHLVVGWCRLARVEGVASTVANYTSALRNDGAANAAWPRTESERQLAAHGALVDRLQTVFEREQRLLNASLGRPQGTGEHLSQLLPVAVPYRASLLRSGVSSSSSATVSAA